MAIVHQPTHPLLTSGKTDYMMRMHLDTDFNVASDGVVVGCDILLKNAES